MILTGRARRSRRATWRSSSAGAISTSRRSAPCSTSRSRAWCGRYASNAVVIAAVDGAAVGAGMDLALACDLRVASRVLVSGKCGSIRRDPRYGGSVAHADARRPNKASELLLTGRLIDAHEALECHLVNTVVPDTELLGTARKMADGILRHPPEGVIANKRAIALAQEAGVEAALVHAAEVQPDRFTSDFRAAVRAARK